jgi:hypothetical protein
VVLNGAVPRLVLALVVAVSGGAVIGTLGACGGDDAPPDAQLPPPVAPPPLPPPVPDFPEDTLSLRLTRTIAVRLGPGDDQKQIGTIAQDIRIGWTRTAKGRGCKRPWVEMVPRGWVCADYLEPQTRPPAGVELPRLVRGEVVPGIYGKVSQAGATTFTLVEPDATGAMKKSTNGAARTGDDREKVPTTPTEGDGAPVAEPAVPTVPADGRRMVAGRPLLGSVNVRKYAEIIVGGKVYWKISPRENEYVLASSVNQHEPSLHRGVRLGDDTGWVPPIGFVWPRWGGTKAWTYGSEKGRWPGRQLDQRTPIRPLATATNPDGKVIAYRLSADDRPPEWIMAGDVRMTRVVEPPPLMAQGERWLDVDLDTQILIAYEGDYPVYATLVSTGTRETPTETGLWRMWKKVAETDMRGLSGEDPYAVATVPWTQFFSPEKGLALHASYWHDKFGIPRSHGCINLSPADARWLYFWTDPVIPPGWTMAAGVSEAPGSIVRVRSTADPNPVWKGYAIKVQELRAAGTP